MLTLLLFACSPPPGPGISLNFAGEGWLDAPFPGEHLMAEGRADVSGVPNPDAVVFVDAVLALLDGASGFGTTSGIFFRSEVALDPSSLPTPEGATRWDASALLVDLETGALAPIEAAYREDGGPFGAEHTLSLLPLQGAPLRPGATWAAVLTTDLLTADGAPIGPAPALEALWSGEAPDGLSDPGPWTDALERLETLGLDPASIAALSVFRTWDPTEETAALVDDIRDHPLEPDGWTEAEVFDDYCVFETTAMAPVYQQGEAPYWSEGGGIHFEDGAPILDRFEEARLVLTVPSGAPPSGGWPTAVFVRTGGGGDRPLVDRGPRDASGEVITPGSGPAMHFARAGYAGLSIDGPHGGLRNITGGDEQFLMFNVGNPTALRDNVRQSAIELALLPDLLAVLSAPGCGVEDDVGFTLDGLALMGHSMGATIAPLTWWADARFEALILSGAGGSWIENVVHKQSPLEVRPIAEAMLGYDGFELTPHDPVLSLLQWAGEPADPPVYADPHGDRHVLMLQGIVDTYILPPIANATSLSFGLDLGGAALDAAHPDLQDFTPLEALLWASGGEVVPLPFDASAGPARLVIQHPEDEVEDGHEVVFQTEPPQHQYRCLLDGLNPGGGGEVTIPEGAGAEDGCAGR